MKYKSNITIASNLYNRISVDEKCDPNFVANVRGRDALIEMKRRLHGSLVSVELNAVQQQELSLSTTCSYAFNYLHEQTHDPVLGVNGVEWKCRCENVNCSRFIKCMPVSIARTLISENDTNVPVSTALEFEWLGVIEQIFSRTDNIEDIPEIEDEPIPQEFTETPDISDDYIKLESPDIIITAGIDSKILVNAGPGTGKTHTVIERLAYIINAGEVDLGQVLILCYTNAARDVILSRLDDMGLGAEARQLVICTLDSLAWSNLTEKTEDDLFAFGYNGCIQRFNAEFDEEEWYEFEYVIIDELQDLVNERARMTLKILKALNCGYLLLGDKCQAIYDYDCTGADSISSVRFYNELEQSFPATVKRYELVGNKRQSDNLSRWTDDLRESLLSFDIKDVNTFFSEEISHLPKSKFLANAFSDLPMDCTTAILTRNNGEAEWVSALLHKDNIKHNLLRSASPRPSLNRWIADMFWDYRELHISRDEFVERYMIRIISDKLFATTAYDALVSAISADRSGNNENIELAELIKALKKGQNLPSLLMNDPHTELTVSTIHKAKGREFDHVYLISGFMASEENTEEARVWYVGSTRPRTKLDTLSHLKIYVSKPSEMNRRLLTGYKRGRYGMRDIKFCSNIVVGLTQDIDSYSFISGDLYHALEIQQYLSRSVAVNDTVELIKNGESYIIFYKDNAIGALSGEATSDFWSAIRRLNNWSGIPQRMTEIYINNIVTVIPGRFPSGADAMFKESKFWLGVELTGFAKADWNYGGNN